MIDISLVSVSKFIEEIDDQKLFEIGRSVAKEFVKPFVVYLYGDFSVDSSISEFRRVALYSNTFKFDDKVDEGEVVLVLRHVRGRKYSRYYSGILEGVYRDLLGKQIKMVSTDELCIVKFPVA